MRLRHFLSGSECLLLKVAKNTSCGAAKRDLFARCEGQRAPSLVFLPPSHDRRRVGTVDRRCSMSSIFFPSYALSEFLWKQGPHHSRRSAPLIAEACLVNPASASNGQGNRAGPPRCSILAVDSKLRGCDLRQPEGARCLCRPGASRRRTLDDPRARPASRSGFRVTETTRFVSARFDGIFRPRNGLASRFYAQPDSTAASTCRRGVLRGFVELGDVSRVGAERLRHAFPLRRTKVPPPDLQADRQPAGGPAFVGTYEMDQHGCVPLVSISRTALSLSGGDRPHEANAAGGEAGRVCSL